MKSERGRNTDGPHLGSVGLAIVKRYRATELLPLPHHRALWAWRPVDPRPHLDLVVAAAGLVHVVRECGNLGVSERGAGARVERGEREEGRAVWAYVK